MACSVNKRFQSALLEREYWENIISSELGDDPHLNLQRTASKVAEEGEISVRELKDFFRFELLSPGVHARSRPVLTSEYRALVRDRTQKWDNIMRTLDWLHSKGQSRKLDTRDHIRVPQQATHRGNVSSSATKAVTSRSRQWCSLIRLLVANRYECWYCQCGRWYRSTGAGTKLGACCYQALPPGARVSYSLA
eukprot:1772411-Rhodomonas_salina.4